MKDRKMTKKKPATPPPPYYIVRSADTKEGLERLLNGLRDEGFAIHYVFPGSAFTVVAWMSAL